MRRASTILGIRLVLCAGLLGLGGVLMVTGEEISAVENEEPAKMKVSGLGWLKNLELRRTLHLLQPEDEELTRFDAAFIEDAVVLLQSSLEGDGFLRSAGTVRFPEAEETDAGPREYAWEPGEVPVLPRDLAVQRVVFALEPGVRYAFEELEFRGLSAMPGSVARTYFLDEGFLLGGGRARRFTPGVLRNGMNNLREQLVRMGYADVEVSVAREERDDVTGKVHVTVAVNEGRVHRVGQIELAGEIPEEVAAELEALRADAADVVVSPLWQQDFRQAARAVLYAEGYADADALLIEGERTADEGGIRRAFRLELVPGPKITVGTVEFTGSDQTERSVLRRAIATREGQIFDRTRVEQDRLKLSTLGIFSSVRAEVAVREPGVWDLDYQLQSGRRLEASVLAGYGSYEQLRAGLELFHANLFGRAHRGRAQLIVSQKAYSGDYLYTIPQIFGTNTDASARVFGLQREEVSFDREEFGASIGARRRITWLGMDASLRYQYESVVAKDVSPDVVSTLPTDTRVGALFLDLTRDRLDNPVTPRRGYLLALSLETAAKALGGEVDYQRLDWRASWHRRVGREKYVHVGFRQGLIWTLGGSAAEDIPLARRYFPGGEGTVRGYREGRAAPRAPDGGVIGAEVSTIVNLEFEQGVTSGLSAVLFLDAGWTAARFDDFPGDQTRVSLGLGLRYNTPIGPARLEYGHNIVRETGDAVGELHFALGFPF